LLSFAGGVGIAALLAAVLWGDVLLSAVFLPRFAALQTELVVMMIASLLVYALPLLLMVAASMVGRQLSGGSDFAAMSGAVAGLASGFLVSKQLQRRNVDSYEPRLLRINRIPAGVVALPDSLT
jgi:hypothetical protein